MLLPQTDVAQEDEILEADSIFVLCRASMLLQFLRLKSGPFLLYLNQVPILHSDFQEQVRVDVYAEDLLNCLEFEKCVSDVALSVKLLGRRTWSASLHGVYVGRHRLVIDDDLYSHCMSLDDVENASDEENITPEPALPTTKSGRQIRLASRFKD